MRTWTVDDVMTREVVAVPETASYRDVVDLLIGHRFSAVPVVDEARRVSGVVSETDLLRKIEYAGDEQPRIFERSRRRDERRKAYARTAKDLMSSPPVVVLTRTPIARAARLMDAERVKRLPVVDDLDRLVGIVSRGDLLKVHLRRDEEIQADIEAGVLRPFLAGDPATVSVAVANGTVTLAGRVEQRSTADIAVQTAGLVPGVVAVTSTLEYAYDDVYVPSPRIGITAT